MFQVQAANGIHYHESQASDKPMTSDQALAILDQYQHAGTHS
jgi:hypothetical protein